MTDDSTDLSDSVGGNPPVASIRTRQSLIILAVAVGVSALTFSAWRYSIGQDRIAGENARLAEQVQQLQQEHQGSEHAETEHQREIARSLQDSLRRNPGDTSLYVQLGAALIATGDTVGSLKAFRKYVLEINPENIGAQTDYGYLLFITGAKEEGRSRTLSVLKRDPKNQVAMYNLAAMSYKEEKIDDAIAWMDRCIAANPSSELSAMAKSAQEQLRQQRSKKE